MAPVYRMIAVAAGMALFIIVIAILVIALLARKLTNPVVSITELIKNAAEGDFRVQADESSKNEIGIMSRSFNKMTQKISAILTKNAIITEEVVESSDNLKQIEKDTEEVSLAVKEILNGSAAQDLDVKQVVIQEETLGNKFEQLREKNRVLFMDAQNTITSGENGMQSVTELEKQNEATSKKNIPRLQH